MATVTRPEPVVVRAAVPGEGAAVAALWRELWDAHERWGGYPGSHDPRVYGRLAARLDQDARVRSGHPVLGRHIHLVAELAGRLCGQVEGWFDQHGVAASTPYTCEVRSLIVAEHARGLGVGRALLERLSGFTRTMARGQSSVLAAEVLEPNPAQTFYVRVGYTAVSWSARMEPRLGGAIGAGALSARSAVAADAPAIARLELLLAARRRAAGDVRFDTPQPIEARTVSAIAAHLSSGASALGASANEPATLVAVDSAGEVRGVCSFAVHALEPPFAPIRRALVGRFSLDPACPTLSTLAPLVNLGCRLAVSGGASQVELTDLSAPRTELHDAALAVGGSAWSRVVTKRA